MNYSKPITYMFNDPKWVYKTLIGVVILFVPILNLAFLGYCIAVIRKSAKGWDELPEWDEIGEKFLDGLKFYLAQLIYTLPISLIVMGLTALAVIPILTSRSDSNGAVVLWILFGVLLVGALSLISLYSVVLTIIQPALLIQYSKKGTFGSFFHFKEIFGVISGNAGNYFLMLLMTIAIGLIASAAMLVINSILGFVPFLGWALTVPASLFCSAWSGLACYQLYGQIQANLPEAA